MNYTFQTSKKFEKDFKKLDKPVQKIIKGWINKNLIDTTDPRKYGKNLKADLNEQWRYRIGDYRVICILEDENFIINALSVGHRKNVYKKH